MEASALQAPAGLARSQISIAPPLLRLRSDEQLVALFRAGNEEAFRVIHDRYRQRLFAYARQMLPGSRHDAEDALQDIFIRAYTGLRASNRKLALRAWLYRVAHNRCIDDLRRPLAPGPEVLELIRPPMSDPMAEVERRDSLRNLVTDIGRLPDQQRSALLMRELGGMPYADLADALGVSVPAVKSLLVRARIGLAQALEARDHACSEVREQLIEAHDRGVRASGLARRHLHDCAGCREFRAEVRGMGRELAMLVPAAGPLGVVANLLGFGSGASGAAGGGAAGGGAAAAATGGAGVVTSAGLLAGGASHVATILAAAVITAGGAVEVQRTITDTGRAHAAVHRVKVAAPAPPAVVFSAPVAAVSQPQAAATPPPAPAAQSAKHPAPPAVAPAPTPPAPADASAAANSESAGTTAGPDTSTGAAGPNPTGGSLPGTGTGTTGSGGSTSASGSGGSTQGGGPGSTKSGGTGQAQVPTVGGPSTLLPH